MVRIDALRNKVKKQLVCLDTQRDRDAAIWFMQTLVCSGSPFHICMIYNDERR